jgi:pyrroline-5-carboxylate reductase
VKKMRRNTIGFIGAGNMAGALIKGLLESGTYQAQTLFVSDKRKEAVENLISAYGINLCESNRSVLEMCDTVVLAVKPQNMKEVMGEIKGHLYSSHFVISIAAGIPLKMISSFTGESVPIARVMPNTPALVQCGISAISFGADVSEELVSLAESIFAAVGKTLLVPEAVMNSVTALSGSGPGYIFYLMECMIKAGVEVGLAEDVSRELVIETFFGSAHLARTSNKSVSQLREMVTSPGGTTAAGLSVMEEMDVKKALIVAIKKATMRARELGDTYS